MNEEGLRYELKYEISPAIAEELSHRLKGLMRPDSHAGPSGYLIRSLYFDDCDCSAYRDKTDGVRDRSKLRLRFYNGDDSYIVFENKEKLGNLTRKTSQRVSRDTALRLSAGEDVKGESGPVIDLYRALRSSGLLQPRVLVDYHRIPFVFTVSNVRITLDLDVRTAPFQTDLFSQRATLPVLDDGRGILEVKYDSILPPYIAEALNAVPKARMSVSKYVKCLGVLE